MSDTLHVLWTTGDKETAMNMVLLYTLNAKKKSWWKEVHLIVWGASSKLLAEDLELQGTLKKMKEAGVKLSACKACADNLNVAEKLVELGIEVIYIGEPFTKILKSGDKLITI